MRHEVTLFQLTNQIQNIRHLYCGHFLGSSEAAYMDGASTLMNAWIGSRTSRLYNELGDVNCDVLPQADNK